MKLGRILTSKEMRVRVGGISRWTEMRMHERGIGPPRIPIDGRSWGYPETLLEEWLLSRLEKPLLASSSAESGR
jgi:predicted DNA-binding transcriptional regulator AlpA